jgi:predicted phage-related endonuclease
VKPFTVIDVEQRSPEWFAARAGVLTGSAASDMLATIKSGEAAARRDLRLRLVLEQITGASQEDVYVSAEMKRGIEVEPLARGAYEAATGNLVRSSGFLASTGHLAGCSLDGHVGEFDGIVEIKCGKSATHLKWLRAGAVPSEHLPQIRHNLWITGAQWCDFVSFDDRFPENLQLLVIRVNAADVDLPGYEAAAVKFLAEVKNEYQSLLGWKGVA